MMNDSWFDRVLDKWLTIIFTGGMIILTVVLIVTLLYLFVSALTFVPDDPQELPMLIAKKERGLTTLEEEARLIELDHERQRRNRIHHYLFAGKKTRWVINE